MPLFKFSALNGATNVSAVSGERPPWNALCESVVVGLLCDAQAEIPEHIAAAYSPGFAAAILPPVLAYVLPQNVGAAAGLLPQMQTMAASIVSVRSSAAEAIPAIIAYAAGGDGAAAFMPRIDAWCEAVVSVAANAVATIPYLTSGAVSVAKSFGDASADIPAVLVFAESARLGGSAVIAAEVPFHIASVPAPLGAFGFGSEDDHVLKYVSSRRYI